MLAAMPGVQVLTPQAHAGLTSFLVDGWDPEQVSNELARRDVVIRWVRNPRNLRVSTGFFNNEQDLVRLREGLLAIQNGRG
jgi:L-cysteine/cystine lyase